MKTIYLDPDEEITSVVDSLTRLDDNEVVLVIPAGAQILQSLVNLKLLKREADNLGKHITIVTSDEIGEQLANRADLMVKEKLSEIYEKSKGLEAAEPEVESEEIQIIQRRPSKRPAKMADIVKPMPKPSSRWPSISTDWLRPEKHTLTEPLKKSRDILERVRRRPSLSTLPSKFFIFFIGLAVVVAGLIIYLVLPRTEIIISPRLEKIIFDLEVVGDKNISQVDSILNKIPLQLIKVEKNQSREFPATDEEELNQKARGIITVYNEYSSSPQTLVVNTRFLSEKEGKLFRTTKTITVPGAKVEEGKIVANAIDVEVVADQPGAEYNIGPANFTIPGFKGTAKYIGFYGKLKDSMTGGFIGKVKVVSQEDLTQAIENLTKELKELAKKSLEEQIPADLQIIERALKEEIVKTSTNAEANSRMDNFSVEIKVALQALLFNQKILQDLVDLNVASRVAENKRPLSETQRITWQEPVIDWQKGEALLPLTIEEDVAWAVDIEILKKDLAGQNEIEVRKYLSQRPEIEKAQVSFWPFWVKRVPWQIGKIKIVVEE